jgi:hypothetical protein
LVVLVSQGGPPEVEYALFDPGEIELLATEPGRIREIGYRTIASQARARLADLGITSKLAREAAVELKAPVARSYARGAAVRRVVDRLGPADLFEGGTFDAATGRYAGAWLALDALGSDLGVARASVILQALHLAAALDECDDDLPVVLATAQVSAERRPGERTYKRVTLDDPAAIVAALATLKPASEREGTDVGPGKQEILDWLRMRTQLLPSSRDRMSTVEAALDTREPPGRGPLADAELWALETKLSAGDASDVAERIEAFERRRGRLPGTMYLRARLALMNRAEDPRTIAERVSALSTSMATFHELQLLAAQAWIAAGDMRRARAFARDLLDNKTASDDMRMGALEVLEVAGQSSSNLAQLPSNPKTLPSAEAPPSSNTGETPAVRVPDSNPTNPDLAPPSSRAANTPASPRSPTAPPRGPSDSQSLIRAGDSRGSPSRRPLASPASTPPYRMETRDSQWSVPPPSDREGEAVESLSLPPGTSAEPPPSDEAPRTPPAARLSFTYLARELGRELRLRHGIQLRNDVEGLELVQRYLREAVPDGRVRSPDEEREVMRTGAFLAELLARRLSARWADLGSQEPGGWSMLLPCRGARGAVNLGASGGAAGAGQVMRVWPFARVMRFVTMGHKERDLVSYYLELDSRAR